MLPFRLYVVADVEAAGGMESLRSKLVVLARHAPVGIYARGLDDVDVEGIRTDLHGSAAVLMVGPDSRVRAGGTHLKASSPLAPGATGSTRGADGRGLLARSTHTVEDVTRARAEGCDFVLFGHVFETPAKRGLPPRGLAGLAEACAAAGSMPVFAIGGVTPLCARAVLAAGAFGAGTVRSVLGPADPEPALRAWLEALRVGETIR